MSGNALVPYSISEQKTKRETSDQKNNINNNVPVRVGVGGLFIYKNKSIINNQECILLYKRYKDPEINKWSLPGGHVDLFLTCEDALKNKTVSILHGVVEKRDIDVLDIVTAVNHFDQEAGYHYVSPQYYLSIKENAFNQFEIEKGFKNTPKTIVLLNTEYKLKKSLKEEYSSLSSKETPWLALVPIKVIQNMDSRELKKVFIKTTVEAVEQHMNFLNNINNIHNTAKESVQKVQMVVEENEQIIQKTKEEYKKWRSSSH